LVPWQHYTTLLSTSMRQPHGTCMNHRLPGGHGWRNITTPQRQSFLPFQSLRQYSTISQQFSNNDPIEFGQESWGSMTNVHLAGFPTCAIRPLQLIQNAPAWLVFNKTERTHVTLQFISLHWLAAHIKFKGLPTGRPWALPPSYLLSLLRVLTSQTCTQLLSRTFLLTVPAWWNDLPNPIWTAEPMTNF